VIRRNNVLEDVSSFNQDEIDEGSISYEHTAVIDGWSQDDSLVFEVSTPYAASLTSQTLDISVSYGNINQYNAHVIMPLGRATVNEGGSVNISKAELDVSKLKKRLVDGKLAVVEVNIVVEVVPRNGLLVVRGKPAAVKTRIFQRDINRGNVTYIHDHSDSLWDSFSFSIEVETSDRVVRTFERSIRVFNITVNPVNDQPFVFRVPSPGVMVLQGLTCNITVEALLTEDNDTLPSGIIYEITDAPTNGHLIHADTPNEPLVTFTQSDVDTNKIVFVQDGSPDSGAFYFRVSDGAHKPLYKIFYVTVEVLSLEVVNRTNVELLQGQMSVVLSPKSFTVQTNGPRDRVMYNVTLSPVYGQLYVDNRPSSQFSQKDLDGERVAYMQTDLRSHEDSFEFVVYFEFIVYDVNNVVTVRTADIVVLPNLKRRSSPFRAYPGPCKLTLGDFDARSLAILTDSDPVFVVVKAPIFGLLTKSNGERSRSLRETKRKGKGREKKKKLGEGATLTATDAYVGAFNFTHGDIANSRVAYLPNPNPAGQFRTDHFSFLLVARNTQPVPVEMGVEIFPTASGVPFFTATHHPHTMALPYMSTASAESNRAVSDVTIDALAASAKNEKKHLMIILIACSVTIVVIVAVITFQCYRRRRQSKLVLEAAKGDSRSPLAADLPSPSSGGGNEQIFMSGRSGPLEGGTSAPSQPSIPVINVMPDTPPGSRLGYTPPGLVPQPKWTDPSVVIETPVPAPLPSNGRTYSVRGRREDSSEQSAPDSADLMKKDQVIFDWENVDPELLQHCRKTTPVLHKNQYWV